MGSCILLSYIGSTNVLPDMKLFACTFILYLTTCTSGVNPIFHLVLSLEHAVMAQCVQRCIQRMCIYLISVLCLQALTGVVSLDVIGLMRNWQFFDHAGHLGGVAFAL